MRIPLSNVDLSPRETAYVEDAVRSGWIGSGGTYTRKAEEAWADFCGAPCCTFACNGTAALHLALLSLNLSPGDEVIVPGMTFVTPAAVVKRIGGVPVFADVEEVSWCIDPEDVRRLITPRTRGVIAVDVLGHPADYDRLEILCADHGIFLIEDAAEAHGSRYKGIRTGGFGACATFSFFANKTLTGGEGGAFVTRDPALLERALLFKNHGMTADRPYWHEVVGDNFRMSNLVAAVLLGQIERAEELLDGRRRVSRLYRECLEGVPHIELRPAQPWAEVVPWLEVLRVRPECPLSRDQLVSALRRDGIDARALWTPLVDLPPYRAECERRGMTTPRARKMLSQLLWLPTASNMPDADVFFVADSVKTALSSIGAFHG